VAESPIRVGIIGANVNYGWGARAHLPALQALPEFEVSAVCTTSMETARETAGKFGVAHAFDDPEALVVSSDVDVVSVCVRLPSHLELTRAALNAGKHVFTEWPLGVTTAEAIELRDLARTTGVRNMVGLQARAAPAVVRMRELIDEGYIGDALTATVYQSLPGAGPRSAERAWMVDASKGATTLTIAAGHTLDALAFCLGEFSSLSALVATQVRSARIADSDETVEVTSPDHVLLNGDLASGAVVSVAIKSVPSHGRGFRFEVHGSEGILEVTSSGMAQMADLTLRGARSGEGDVTELPLSSTCRWVPEGLDEPGLNVAQLFRRLGERIRDGGDAEPDFAHAVRVHELLDAIQRSSDTGQRETL
jgi:predicted dehydrogenase